MWLYSKGFLFQIHFHQMISTVMVDMLVMGPCFALIKQGEQEVGLDSAVLVAES